MLLIVPRQLMFPIINKEKGIILMKTYTITLNQIDKIRKFNEQILSFESDIDITKGRYIIDAKSLIGLFTIDLAEPFNVVIHSDDKDELEKFDKFIQEFIKK